MTAVPVLTAVSDAVWEAELVSALERADLGISVVRRCVDLPDLLAVAASRVARAAIVSAELRRLDRDALVRLALSNIAVIAVVEDDEADRRMRAFGLGDVVFAAAGAEAIVAAVHDAVSKSVTASGSSYGEPRVDDVVGEPSDDVDLGPADGRLVAVWGPTGAPGRTTVAVTLASELADLGVSTMLADADVYGGVIAQALGLLDESAGLAGAARLANAGTLDLAGLADLARTVGPRLRVLTGIARADRWPELRPHALDVVWSLARGLAAVTVVDCGFGLEQDEELSYDTMAPRRNGATLGVLEVADAVVVVGAADPIGLQRLVRGLSELRDAVPGVAPIVVVNRVRRGVVGPRPDDEIAAALARYAGVVDAVLVPYDRSGVDAALEAGRTLLEVAAGSPVRVPLRMLAGRLGGVQASAPRRRLLARR